MAQAALAELNNTGNHAPSCSRTRYYCIVLCTPFGGGLAQQRTCSLPLSKQPAPILKGKHQRGRASSHGILDDVETSTGPPTRPRRGPQQIKLKYPRMPLSEWEHGYGKSSLVPRRVPLLRRQLDGRRTNLVGEDEERRGGALCCSAIDGIADPALFISFIFRRLISRPVRAFPPALRDYVRHGNSRELLG